MNIPQIINRELFNRVSSEARAASRRRKNFNFHAAETEASHRLLNAMEPDSYIPPHCHLDASKDESIIALAGRFGVVFFDHEGKVTGTAILAPGGEAVGVNIPHGVFHSLVALESGSLFFEAKAGPYKALEPAEKASWAPAEGGPDAVAYLGILRSLF
ncbi:MAG: WbuC family cupin fold metalloprotein [Gammaproteobacteria bacterium]|nr:WbuC family cupin fold metalloprotein [Gammaproteobacteria bacterium]MBU1979690.1 WbuC family cupin fold metalloprotein [Gammaproteobacteria bacterium]